MTPKFHNHTCDQHHAAPGCWQETARRILAADFDRTNAEAMTDDMVALAGPSGILVDGEVLREILREHLERHYRAGANSGKGNAAAKFLYGKLGTAANHAAGINK